MKCFIIHSLAFCCIKSSLYDILDNNIQKKALYMKTLIELFDTCQIQNIIAGLKLNPEKIIFVGFDKVMRDKRINDLKNVLCGRNPHIVLEFRKVSRYDYEKIYCALDEIVADNKDCVFDLTGGKELVLAAMGELSVVRDIPMVQFNVRTGNLIRVKNSDNIVCEDDKGLSIDECVKMNGGSVIKNTETDYEWDFNDEFRTDVLTLWEICKENCREWNIQANMFDLFEKTASFSYDGIVKIKLSQLEYNKKLKPVNEDLLRKLAKHGFITDYLFDGENLSFGYKNQQIKQCLLKAGNILELYTYVTAFNICKKEPGFFDDSDVGVFVDWDGIITGETDGTDTRNELDVVFTRGYIPVFISCKNGQVHKEDLYELYTVGEKFGGEYSKLALICTYISNDVYQRETIINRAKTMNIEIIDSVDEMSYEEFESVLKRRMS